MRISPRSGSNLLQRLGMEEGVSIESRMITRRIEAAQKPSKARTSNPANTSSNTTT